jgi:hypothetical protein
VRRLAITILALGVAGCGAPGATAPATSTTKATVKLPVVDVANTAACQNEAQTIAAAESMWSTLHDERLASLEQLVGEQYLRSAPEYYRSIRVGDPAGGYTLVGTPGKCGDWPVAGAGR